MNVFQFAANFILITLLGLLIAFSPLLIAVNMLVVLKSSRPIIRTLVLMAGIATPLIIVAILAVVLIKPQDTISFSDVAHKISIPPLFYIVFGLWLVFLGARRMHYAHVNQRPKHPTSFIMQHPPDRLSSLYGFAFLKSALSATNIFAILVVTELITTLDIKKPLALITVLWVIIVGLLPFAAILYFYFYKHERLERLNERVDIFLNRDIDFAINLILITVGALFAVSAFVSELKQ